MEPINTVFSKLLLSLMVMLVSLGTICAQQPSISGRVTDQQGIPLAGASVDVEGGSASVRTDNDGAFTIAAAPGSVLVVSYIGYSTQSYTVGSEEPIVIALQPTANDLDEVVVVGYTTQRRTTITGAVGTVSMADAQKRRVPDVR